MVFRNREEARGEDLDRALAAWRCAEQGPAEGLSEAVRARILREARDLRRTRAANEPLASLFLPLPRLALGALVPVAVLALVLVGAMAVQGDLPTGSTAGATITRVDATKSGNNVVFVIHDGSGSHTVARSTDPGLFDAGPVVRTESGRFRDRLSSDPSIVYYRID